MQLFVRMYRFCLTEEHCFNIGLEVKSELKNKMSILGSQVLDYVCFCQARVIRTWTILYRWNNHKIGNLFTPHVQF